MRLTLIIVIVLLFASCTPTEKIDLIVHNAKLYTVNDIFDVTEAMAIDDGKIIAVGPENEIRNKYLAKEYLDAQKRPVYPGFIDAHCHFVGYAKNLNRVDLMGTKSFEEVLERVKLFAKNNSSEWIVGRGWDQNDWEVKEFPTRKELDELFPNTPVLLTRVDGHAALVNGKALSIAKINSETKVDGGIITFMVEKEGAQIQLKNTELNSFKNYSPQPSGILIDNAIDLVTKHITNSEDKVSLTTILLAAQEKLFEVGLTTVDDAGLEQSNIDLIDELQQQNKLKIKVYAMISGNEKMLEHYLAKGPYKTNKLTVNSFKFYADGALGSRGACLLEPYSDIIEQQHYGLMVTEKDFFEKYAPLLYEKGFQMNTHCIGDSANRMILDIYKNTLKGINDKRWRIEHAQVIEENDFKTFAEYNIIPSVQPTHATSDMYWVKDRLGEHRVKNAYAYKKLLKQNGLLALGTDFPVEGINPMNTFYAAVVRKDSENFPENGYQMENSLTRQEALKGMTIWAAISNFEENEKGSLEVGKSADFVLLNNDIMETKEDEILNTKVLATYVNGEKVFSTLK